MARLNIGVLIALCLCSILPLSARPFALASSPSLRTPLVISFSPISPVANHKYRSGEALPISFAIANADAALAVGFTLEYAVRGNRSFSFNGNAGATAQYPLYTFGQQIASGSFISPYPELFEDEKNVLIHHEKVLERLPEGQWELEMLVRMTHCDHSGSVTTMFSSEVGRSVISFSTVVDGSSPKNGDRAHNVMGEGSIRVAIADLNGCPVLAEPSIQILPFSGPTPVMSSPIFTFTTLPGEQSDESSTFLTITGEDMPSTYTQPSSFAIKPSPAATFYTGLAGTSDCADVDADIAYIFKWCLAVALLLYLH